MNLRRAIKLIEKRRTDINELYDSVLTDDNALSKSRKLDELLNKYDRMLKKQSECY